MAELGAQIARDYGDEIPVVVGVLQGAFVFMADLVRAMHRRAGLARLTRERCDFLIRLPMRGQIASLNAAVAGSIVLYYAWRVRR